MRKSILHVWGKIDFYVRKCLLYSYLVYQRAELNGLERATWRYCPKKRAFWNCFDSPNSVTKTNKKNPSQSSREPPLIVPLCLWKWKASCRKRLPTESAVSKWINKLLLPGVYRNWLKGMSLLSPCNNSGRILYRLCSCAYMHYD